MSMNPEQEREFVAVVQEMRRLQVVTPKPYNATARKIVTEAESKVDELVERYREREPGEDDVPEAQADDTPTSP